MDDTKILLRKLLVFGLVVGLCTCGWAAQGQGSANKNQGTAAQQGQAATQPGTAQQGSAGAGIAQPQRPSSSQTAQTGQAMMLEKTSTLIGKTVKDAQGGDLGMVHDIVLSPDYQQVSYVALSSDSAMGAAAASKFHAIPWQALRVGSKGDITTTITKDQLSQAPGFTRDNWPSQADTRWLSASAAGAGQTAARSGQTAASQSREDQGQAATSQGQNARSQGQAAAGQSQTARSQGQAAAGQDQTTRSQGQAAMGQDQTARSQGQTAASESQAGQAASSMGTTGQTAMANESVQMRRVTRLIGMAVKNPTGEDLGDLEDLAVSVADGRIIYDIISFSGAAAAAEQLAAVPANAVRIQPQTHTALLNATRQTLEAATFKSSEFYSLGTPEQMQRLRQAFPAQPAGTALGYVPPQSPQVRQAADERAWGPDSRHAKSFNASAVKTIRGTVESIGSFQPEGAAAGASPGLRLRVKASDGNLMTIYAGPINYAEQKNFHIMPGEEITVTGSQTRVGARSVVIASELKKGSQTLQLRDQSGKPLWTMGGQAGQGAMQSARPGTTPQAGTTGRDQTGATNRNQSGQTENRTRKE